MTAHQLDVLATLASVIESRKGAPASNSYTAKLMSQGIEKCAKKFGEESVEAALAAMTGDRRHLASEAADVLYHLLVLLAAADVKLDDVMAELKRREGMSGLAEKAQRSGD